jgi:hypothetical protein
MWETQQMGGATARRVLSVDDHDDVVVDWEVP